MERQRVLPVVTVSSSVRRHLTPLHPTCTTTTTNTTTASTSDTTAPSGEPASSRVLPPVNAPDLLSEDQLREQTEKILQCTVHKDATPTDMDAVTTVDKGAVPTDTAVHKDAMPAQNDTVSNDTTVQKDATPTPMDTDTTDTAGHKDASPTFVDTVSATTTTVTPTVPTASVNDSSCDTVTENKVSADVGADNDGSAMLEG